VWVGRAFGFGVRDIGSFGFGRKVVIAHGIKLRSNSDNAKAATANYANRQPPFPNEESPILTLLI
jgi:hypothetical protein